MIKRERERERATRPVALGRPLFKEAAVSCSRETLVSTLKMISIVISSMLLYLPFYLYVNARVLWVDVLD